jgi:exonuclease III
MKIRVASWNVRGLPCPQRQIWLLADCHLDILLLQDVSQRATDAISSSGHWKSVATSLNSGPHPQAGCLVAARADWQFTDSTGIPGDASSSRALAVSAVNHGVAVTLVSCYAPTNVGQGRKERPGFFNALADWLSTLSAPFMLGIDANGPRTDHPDITRNKWWVPEESSVLGAETSTEDALRRWYDDHPDALRRRVQYYPRGPLADSYHRGRKGKFVRSRYDSIRISPGIIVEEVNYLYDEALVAGSDHALVVAVLAVTD